MILAALPEMNLLAAGHDNGLIRTLDVHIYLTKVSGSSIYCLDRDGKNRIIRRCYRIYLLIV
jgi:coatomer protein complex subunit alpha (xenin)